MQISHFGLDLIKKFEGFREKAYLCSAGVATIGYGTTLINNSPVKLGLITTREKAEEYLRLDVRKFERCVSSLVTVDLNQKMFDALVSFVYNVGEGNLRASTLLRRINDLRYEDAANEFSKWNKAKGKVIPGLVSRRAGEASLFRDGIKEMFPEQE